MIRITLPMDEKTRVSLKAGDEVLLTGVMYTARDAAHKRITDALKTNAPLPFPLKDSVIYYTGPTPTKPGKAIGSCGPTTSYRMDSFMEDMAKAGSIGSIGKGERSVSVKKICKEYKCVYFVTTGGIGALLSKCIKEATIIAYPDLGAEAVRKIYVEDFPVLVAYDAWGNDLFEED